MYGGSGFSIFLFLHYFYIKSSLSICLCSMFTLYQLHHYHKKHSYILFPSAFLYHKTLACCLSWNCLDLKSALPTLSNLAATRSLHLSSPRQAQRSHLEKIFRGSGTPSALPFLPGVFGKSSLCRD